MGGAVSKISSGWSSLAEAVKFLMEAGTSEEEAKQYICDAICKQILPYRILVDESDLYGGRTLYENEVAIPKINLLSHEHFDWVQSRPLTEWLTEPHWEFRKIALIELSNAGLDEVCIDRGRIAHISRRLADRHRNELAMQEAVRRVGVAIFGNAWIGNLSLPERLCLIGCAEWHPRDTDSIQHDPSDVLPKGIRFAEIPEPIPESHEPSENVQRLCDAHGRCVAQYEEVAEWMFNHGYCLDEVTVEVTEFEHTMALEFARPSEKTSEMTPSPAPNAATARQPAPVSYSYAPGPRGGEKAVKRRAWEIAEEILRGDTRPARGHGRRSALARLVTDVLEQEGLHREMESVRKYIRDDVRDWELKNPNL